MSNQREFIDRSRPGNPAPSLDQITVDLQRKITDDVTAAIVRTIELSRFPSETMTLMLQAAAQTLKLVHDGLESARKEPIAITATALLCAKALEDARSQKGPFSLGDALDECERQAELLRRAK